MTRRKQLTRVALALTILVLVGLVWVNRHRFTPLDVGSRAPDYTVHTLTGEEVALSSYRGDVVLLNVWATWCRPCVKEMPALQRLHESLGDAGLRIVAVSVDANIGDVGWLGQPGGDVRAFADRYGLTFAILRDPSGNIQRRYQVGGLPMTYLIDRTGRIRKKVMGAREWDEPALANEVRSMLGEG